MPTVQTATVRYMDNMAFTGTAGSGHIVWMDADASAGGENGGFRPTEMLLMALAGCSGMDVVSMLRKMRQDITEYRIEVSGSRRDEHPRIFTDITVEHVVTGHRVDPARVERAVRLSEEKYCSASAMLSRAAQVTHTWRVMEASQPLTGAVS